MLQLKCKHHMQKYFVSNGLKWHDKLVVRHLLESWVKLVFFSNNKAAVYCDLFTLQMCLLKNT